MSGGNQTEVLIVGAGPVGLLTALLLAEEEIQVQIIDQEERTASRSYACALHPHSIQLLERVGIASDVLDLGHRLQKIAFYERESRRAELNVAWLSTRFPFITVLPQSALEGLLEERLKRKAGIRVQWNHRLSDLQLGDDDVVATVDTLGGTATGYIVPHWEVVVKNRQQLRPEFVVGADGHNSVVRQRLGITCETLRPPESFVVAQFESDWLSSGEGRVVLDGDTTNVLWPLPNGACRWSFQLLHADRTADFPAKERSGTRFCQGELDEKIRAYVRRVAQVRAPWFNGSVDAIQWFADVQFQSQLANQFGAGRCWLVGDAAHQTSPAGMQSMNFGLEEAADLAWRIKKVLRDEAELDVLKGYNESCRRQWEQLLLTNPLPVCGNGSDTWTKGHWTRILPCIPASELELDSLAQQLGIATN